LNTELIDQFINHGIRWVKFLLTFIGHNASLSETVTLTEPACGSLLPSAEVVPDDSASAPCYGAAENILILAVVKAKCELVQIQGVLLADIVIGAHDATLEQRPKVFHAVRVDLTAHVFAFAMPDNLMRVQFAQFAISRMLVGCEQTDVGRYGLVNEAIQGLAFRILDHAANHVALPRDSADDGRFSGSLAPGLVSLFVPMAVTVAAADKGFIDFHDAEKLAELRVSHPGPQSVTDIEGGLVRTASNHPVDLKGAHPLLAGQHEVKNLEPSSQRIVGVLEDRSDIERETVRGIATPLADPMEWLPVEFADLISPTPGAADAIRPPAAYQIFLASVLIWEHLIEIRKGHLLYEFRLMLVVLLHE
jgi:hypothetical protein